MTDLRMMTDETRKNVLAFRHELRARGPHVEVPYHLRKPGPDAYGELIMRRQRAGDSWRLYAYKNSMFTMLYLLENYDAIEDVTWRDVEPLMKYELA